MEDLSKYLTPSQVAEKLGVTRQQIDKWLRSGRIRFSWYGPERRVKKSDAVKPEPAAPGPKPKPDKAVRPKKKGGKING